jgi:hypothetical protein
MDTSSFTLARSPWCVFVAGVFLLVLFSALLGKRLVMVLDFLRLLLPHISNDLGDLIIRDSNMIFLNALLRDS